MEQKITDLIEETIKSLGFELVKVNVHGGSSMKIVEILIENIDENVKIHVGDCQLVSKNISAILDVEDIIPGKYFLEVSSAGIERPLTKLTDYIKFSGKEVKIRLKTPFNGNLSFKGKLLGLGDSEGNSVEFDPRSENQGGENYADKSLQGDDSAPVSYNVKLQSKNIVLAFDYDNIKSAKLTLTDEMFRDILNKKPTIKEN